MPRGIRGLRAHVAIFSRDSSSTDLEGQWQGGLTEVVRLRGTWKQTVADRTEDNAGRPADENRATFDARNNVTVLPGDICHVVGTDWVVEAVQPALSGVTRYMLKRPLPGPFA